MLKGCNGSLARSGSPRPSNGLRLRTATRAARACVAAVLRGALRHRGAQQLLHALPAPRARARRRPGPCADPAALELPPAARCVGQPRAAPRRMRTLSTRCCVAGGGPAGMMLGLLLARAGVDVIVLEKHADFLRDFRGDTIHPSTLEVMHELGVLDEFLTLPHQKARSINAQFGDLAFAVADFSRLTTRCKYTVLMPQW